MLRSTWQINSISHQGCEVSKSAPSLSLPMFITMLYPGCLQQNTVVFSTEPNSVFTPNGCKDANGRKFVLMARMTQIAWRKWRQWRDTNGANAKIASFTCSKYWTRAKYSLDAVLAQPISIKIFLTLTCCCPLPCIVPKMEDQLTVAVCGHPGLYDVTDVGDPDMSALGFLMNLRLPQQVQCSNISHLSHGQYKKEIVRKTLKLYMSFYGSPKDHLLYPPLIFWRIFTTLIHTNVVSKNKFHSCPVFFFFFLFLILEHAP